MLQTWVLIWKCHFTELFVWGIPFFVKASDSTFIFKIKAPTLDVVIIKNIEPEGTLVWRPYLLTFVLKRPKLIKMVVELSWWSYGADSVLPVQGA